MKIHRFLIIGAALATLLLGQANSVNAGIIDATNDFLPTYVGTHAGDLDVTSIDVAFDGHVFTLTANLNANVGTTTGALYVWGVNRGAGTARFAAIAPGVLFDSVVLLTNSGTGTVNRVVGGGSSALGSSDITISGKTIVAKVAASLLPGQGFDPASYTFNLWPRLGAGNNNQISDFAPDNRNVAARFVPEPSTLLSASFASLFVGLIARSRRKALR